MTITILDIRREVVRRSFEDFLRYVSVLSPEPSGDSIIPFIMWPHLKETVDIILRDRLVIILKARQIGISWLLAAYALWTASYHPGALVMVLSKGQEEASDLLDKIKFIHRQLPPELQQGVGKSNEHEMAFPSIDSSIVALPSTEHAGRSKAVTLVFHEYLSANFAAVKPTIDAGGQMITASTVNKRKVNSLFKQLYRGAEVSSE